MNNFDIDLWIKLAINHPYKFEQQREQWLEYTILNASTWQKPRLQGLRWEIKMDLEIAKNKYRNCKFISARLVEHLQSIKDLLTGDMPVFINTNSATILNFVQPRD